MQEHYGLTRIVSDTETWRLEEKKELHVFRSKTNNCSVRFYTTIKCSFDLTKTAVMQDTFKLNLS